MDGWGGEGFGLLMGWMDEVDMGKGGGIGILADRDVFECTLFTGVCPRCAPFSFFFLVVFFVLSPFISSRVISSSVASLCSAWLCSALLITLIAHSHTNHTDRSSDH